VTESPQRFLANERSIFSQRSFHHSSFTPPIFDPSNHFFTWKPRALSLTAAFVAELHPEDQQLLFGEVSCGLSGDSAIEQVDRPWNVALLEILRGSSIDEGKAVLPSLQIKPNIGRVGFYRKFRQKVALCFLRPDGWRFQNKRKM
jgi:hypothetical protein